MTSAIPSIIAVDFDIVDILNIDGGLKEDIFFLMIIKQACEIVNVLWLIERI